MADSPTSWGATPVEESPEAWGAVPSESAPKKKSIYTRDHALSDSGKAILAGMSSEGESAFNRAGIGQEFTWGKTKARKIGPDSWEADDPEAKLPDSSFAGALARAGIIEAPAAAAGAAAFGAAQGNPVVQQLQRSPLLPARVAGMGIPLVAGFAGGVTGSMATRGAVGAAMPELATQLEADQEAHPNAVVAGSALANAPFFRVGGGVRPAERAVGGSIAAGVQGGTEAYSGEVDEDTLVRMALAGVGGAAFTDPTKAGRAAMNAGAALNKKPITEKLGNASTKSTPLQANAVANEIAMEPSLPPMPEPDAMSIMLQEKAQANLPQTPAGAPKASESKELGKITILDPETAKPLEVNVDGPLGDFQPQDPFIPKNPNDTELFNRRVKGVIDNLGKEGVEIDRQTAVKLARITDRKEFNNARQRLIDSIKPPEIPAEGPLEKADAESKAPQVAPEAVPFDPVAFGAEEVVAPTPTQEAVANKPEAAPSPTLDTPMADAVLEDTTLTDTQKINLLKRAKRPKKVSIEDDAAIEAAAAAQNKPIEPSSQAMGIVPGDDALVKLTKKGVDKANDTLLNKMAETEVRASQPEEFDAFDSFAGKTKAPTKEDAAIEFPTPGEGNLSPMAKDINAQLKKAKKPLTREEIWEQVKRDAGEQGSPEPDAEVATHIESAPEEYRPGLSDLAARFPVLEKIPLGKSFSNAVGSVAKAAKVAVGTVETNIKDASPRIFGGLRTKIGELNEMRTKYSKDADDFGTLARKNLEKDQYAKVSAAALSGDRAGIEAVISKSPKAKELMAALDKHQRVMQEIRDLHVAGGRDIGVADGDVYFHRKLVDRKGLLKSLGREQSTYNDALKAAAREKGVSVADLTPEEKDSVLNNLILGSVRNAGKPGFLKPRTIQTIEENMLRFYEPIDVSTHEYVMSSTRDISNRKWFGKTAEDGQPFEGNFGRLLREEVQSGRLDSAQDQVIRNLQDYFVNSYKWDNEVSGLANKARKIQTYAYLADIANMIPQYADFFSAWSRYGLGNAGKGYFNRKFKLEDINIHEGHNQDLVGLSNDPNRNPDTAVGKLTKAVGETYNRSMKLFLQHADEVNKGGIANAAYRWVNDVVKDPDSLEFQRLNEAYSKAFPERWPEILKDLRSPEFAKGKLNENTRFFLFNELANLQPLDASGRAQGYNRSNPWTKILYTLRSYAIKQLDIMRDKGYNEIKRGNVREGIKNLAAYAVIVGVGQQVATYAKDKFLGRDTDPSEYAITGLLQLAMVPRYAVYRAKEEGAGTAFLETLVPGVGLGNDITKDVQTAIRGFSGQRDSEGRRTVESLEDFFKQSRTIQYLPAVGREIYWWAGRGAEQEKRNAQMKAEGKEKPGTIDSFLEFINPPDLGTARKN